MEKLTSKEVNLCKNLSKAVKRLANLHHFTTEFGKMGQVGNSKVWGAGIISAFGEMEYCCTYEGEGEQNRELAHAPFSQEYMINV